MKRKLKSSIKIIIGILLIILIAVLIYGFNLSKIGNSTDDTEFVISSGDTIDKIINNLKEDNLIRSVLFTKIHIKLNNLSTLQAGTYKLNNSLSTIEILNILNKGKAIANDIKITFPEGITIKSIAKIIEKNTNNKQEEVYNLLKDETYIDSLIDDYWFITEDVKNSELLYPLEGYLAMNTYLFKSKDVTVKEIFNKMLDQMEIILNKYKDDIENSNFNIHELLTFSSIVQAEGNSFSTMSTLAGLFYNRLENKMAFESCPTNCYPRGIEPCTPNRVDKSYNSPYNTYLSSMAGKLPIGPISSFGEDAIKATVKPEDNDYFFVVADKNGKVYFNKTNKDHEKKISELKQKGLWF